jgi:hypothetical protein
MSTDLARRDELRDTASFVQTETLRRLDAATKLVSTATTPRQVGDRLLTVWAGSSTGGSFGIFLRFRNLSAEDLFLQLQIMCNFRDMEPVNLAQDVRLTAIDWRDGNADLTATPGSPAFTQLKADALDKLERLRIWATSRDLTNVTHFVKFSAQGDRLIKIAP